MSADAASFFVVDEASAGQRIDNYLAKTLKGVPKSHVYRILRSGEVRVNKGRVDASYKLAIHDQVRIPPIRVSAPHEKPHLTVLDGQNSFVSKLEPHILFEDDAMLVLNKPAGLAVHGGSGVSKGVIEQLRLERPKAKFLELVHRLDRETSGVLLIAKKRAALVALHEAIRSNQTDKRYLMLVKGEWKDKKRIVKLNLLKFLLPNGERRVKVLEASASHPEAQMSETVFYLKQSYGEYSLLEGRLVTGRTHQLRVQLAHLGFPILGDDKYGDFEHNKVIYKQGLKRMFLHSAETMMKHPISKESLHLTAILPKELAGFLPKLAVTTL